MFTEKISTFFKEVEKLKSKKNCIFAGIAVSYAQPSNYDPSDFTLLAMSIDNKTSEVSTIEFWDYPKGEVKQNKYKNIGFFNLEDNGMDVQNKYHYNARFINNVIKSAVSEPASIAWLEETEVAWIPIDQKFKIKNVKNSYHNYQYNIKSNQWFPNREPYDDTALELVSKHCLLLGTSMEDKSKPVWFDFLWPVVIDEEKAKKHLDIIKGSLSVIIANDDELNKEEQ